MAFIVEPDGNLLATSRRLHLGQRAGGASARLNAADSEDHLIAATYRFVSDLTGQPGAMPGSQTTAFDRPDGEMVQAGYWRVQDDACLEWQGS